MADDAMMIDSKESTAAPELLASTATTADDPNDPDPITASYNIFLNPSLPLGRRLLILQQPNRTDNVARPSPTELRVKSQAGMVEVDMPMNTSAAYDREKGLEWGRKLKSSLGLKNGGTHGLAGGFGAGATTGGGRGKKKGEEEDDTGLDWNEAVRQDKVLRTQTLGGQYPVEREVQYMVGVFQGQDLHLTPVSSHVHLRPQLHHIDASTHLERHAASKEASGSGSAGSGAGAASAARAIHMTVKATADGNSDGNSTETMADRLRNVQGEGWRRMRYTDENEEVAWDVYNESMFLRPEVQSAQATTAAPQIGTSEDKGKEEAKEGETKLEDIVGTFESRWNEKVLLEKVSGIVKPEDHGPEEPEEEVKKEPEPPMEAPPRASSGRGRGRGAARARGRGRGRAA